MGCASVDDMLAEPAGSAEDGSSRLIVYSGVGREPRNLVVVLLVQMVLLMLEVVLQVVVVMVLQLMMMLVMVLGSSCRRNGSSSGSSHSRRSGHIIGVAIGVTGIAGRMSGRMKSGQRRQVVLWWLQMM